MAVSEQKLRVGGMDCAGCATKIEQAVSKLPGVESVDVSVGAGTLRLTGSDSMDIAAVRKTVTSLGYTVAPHAAVAPNKVHDHKGHPHDHAGHKHDDGHDHGPEKDDHASHSHDHGAPIPDGMRWWQTPKGKLVIATGIALVVAFLISRISPQLGLPAYTIAMLIGLFPVAQRAIAAARAGVYFTIEMLMTIAAIGALLIGAAEEAAVVVFLFAVGELLEGVAAQSARSSIRALGDLIPTTVVVEDAGGATRTVDTASLIVGTTIVVRPGDRMPADGTIVAGASDIDEAPVTGESVPRAKTVGAEVFAGSINKTGALKVAVTRPTADNTIARIIKTVEEAQEAKAPFERFIDRFARWYMPAIVGLALLVAIIPPLFGGADWYTWIYRALTLLLIGCPCALVIATPAAIASSLSAGARHGILIKGGTVLEAASKLRTIAFDKTGTLTEGRPSVTDAIGIGHSDNDVLAFAAAVERGSNHPIAIGILKRADELKVAVPAASDILAIAGEGMTGTVDDKAVFFGAPKHAAKRVPISHDVNARIAGLQADGKTVSVLLVDKTVIGLIAVRDEPRAGVGEALADVKALGLNAIMLTGDNATTARAIAANLGLEARADLMPSDKLEHIKREVANGGIAMVGDGINDAPALAAATIGIAMAGGTGVALETADAALVGDRISGVVDLIRLSRATMANIRQNVIIALGSKAVFLVTTILGMTGLWIAVIADTGATVLVTLNALRLLGFRSKGL